MRFLGSQRLRQRPRRGRADVMPDDVMSDDVMSDDVMSGDGAGSGSVASSLVGPVADRIAHDLNNLLSVIRNYASFIIDESAEGAQGRDAERWRLIMRDAQQIDTAVERAIGIVLERIQPLAELP